MTTTRAVSTLGVAMGLGVAVVAQDQPRDLQDFLLNDLGLASEVVAPVTSGDVIASRSTPR